MLKKRPVQGRRRMHMKRHLLNALAFAAVLALIACSEAPKPAKTKAGTEGPKKEPAGPPVPVTAKTAFWEVYKPARGWATDLLPLSVANGDVPDMQPNEGKAAVWIFVFVSP